ncbi:hypothetical protein MtrunA17_Chr6g0457961 [Medicago truncatula]|uniref:Uncharacterized protein n=1 Tax=Medicago truncatula TaxID=3880 RepID=A0A396HAZ0_MEDTR|nr:hypothetical protein MtrunA17_Chr6g0457961 [Medicago truncatula]
MGGFTHWTLSSDHATKWRGTNRTSSSMYTLHEGKLTLYPHK